MSLRREAATARGGVSWWVGKGGHCQVRLDKAAAGVGGLRCLIRNKREGWSNELKTMLITGGEQKAAESFLFISFFFVVRQRPSHPKRAHDAAAAAAAVVPARPRLGCCRGGGGGGRRSRGAAPYLGLIQSPVTTLYGLIKSTGSLSRSGRSGRSGWSGRRGFSPGSRCQGCLSGG